MFILLCNFLSFLLAIQEFLSYIVSTASLVTHTGYIYIYALTFYHLMHAHLVFDVRNANSSGICTYFAATLDQ